MLPILKAIELLRDKRPQELTADESAGLRELIERNPACVGMLGGRDAVEKYLAAAPGGAEYQPPTKARATEAPNAIPLEDGTPAVPLAPSPRFGLLVTWILAGAGVVVLGFLAYLWVASKQKANVNNQAADVQTTGKPAAQSASAATNHRHAQPSASDKNDDDSAADAPSDDDPKLWHGWKMSGEPGGTLSQKTVWDVTSDPLRPTPATVIQIGRLPATLTADKLIEPGHRWLRMVLIPDETAPPTGTMALLADSHPIARVTLDSSHLGTPLVVSLERCLGRTVKLQLRYLPASEQSAIQIKSLELSAQSTRVAWTPLSPSQLRSDNGTTITAQPDGSIVASGPNPDGDTYHVTIGIPPTGATALRIEALPDASLPDHGPGRASGGSFAISRVSAVLTASIKQQEKVPARYVRIELTGRPRALTLAEVEVFSGGENVARKKKATQCSTLWGAVAGRAVDGNKNANFKRGSVSHTGNQVGAWWMVDLGQEFPIEKIVIWNRESASSELAHHRVIVTDSQNHTTWVHDNPIAPVPNVAYGPFVTEQQPVRFTDVLAEGTAPGIDLKEIVREESDGNIGWNGALPGQSASAVFTLAPDQKLAGQQVTLTLVHRFQQAGQNLGRFRIYSTNAPPPHQPEPALIELPSLP
ncbi:MAG: hypothetical protein K8T25_10930 [Planctomycetia bacterium]|nr:hypothetical protein [Planctomycetia bacterium]